MEFILPRVQKTGEVALLEATTRPSSRMPAVVNFRFNLPRRTLQVQDGEGNVATLPRLAPGEAAYTVIQFPAVMN